MMPNLACRSSTSSARRHQRGHTSGIGRPLLTSRGSTTAWCDGRTATGRRGEAKVEWVGASESTVAHESIRSAMTDPSVAMARSAVSAGSAPHHWTVET
jgi:hypothetical protein